MASPKATTESDTSDQKTKKSIRDRLVRYILIRYRLVRYILLIRCRLTRYKLIRYSIAFSPIFLGGLLLIFGDAYDLYSKMVVVFSLFVTASLVFYNYQADNPDNPDHLYKTEPRFVDQALIVSLWVFGAIGVLLKDWVLNLEIYFQTITALAVMYVLLVAFRIDRLVRRTAEEEELTLDLMGEAMYWRTIYQRDVEAVIGRWQYLVKQGYGKKIEEVLIEKQKKYLKELAKEKELAEECVKELSEELAETLPKELVEILAEEYVRELPKELAKNPPRELTEIFGEKFVGELAKELVKDPAELYEVYVKEIAKRLANTPPKQFAEQFSEGLAEILAKEYAKKPLKKLAKILERKRRKKYQSSNIKHIPSFEMGEEFAEELAEELAEFLAEEYAETLVKYPKEFFEKLVKEPSAELDKILVEEYAGKTPAELAKILVEGYAGKTPAELAEILVEKKKEKYQSSTIKYTLPFEMGEEFAKELAELVKKHVKEWKEDFRDRIDNKCAADLLAAKVMIEVIEKIDKNKSEKELINAYRFSIMSINLIEEWEKEKFRHPAQKVETAEKNDIPNLEAALEMGKAKLGMLEMEEDKPQGSEIERAKLKRQVQEWERQNPELKKQVQELKIKKSALKEQVQEWERQKSELEKQVQEWEIEKPNLLGRTDERILKLREFQTDFTKFINSRQQGNNLSELIAIGAIGFALIALMNLGFPEGIRGYGAFSVHLFTLFTSTIVVFLFFNILDLGNDRDRSLHDVGPDDRDLWENPVHYNYRSPNPTWIYIVSAVTTIVYVWLLWDKLVSPYPSFLY